MTYKEEILDKLRENFPRLELSKLSFNKKNRAFSWTLDPDSNHDIFLSLAKPSSNPKQFTLTDGLTLSQEHAYLTTEHFWNSLKRDIPDMMLKLIENPRLKIKNHPLQPLVPEDEVEIKLGYNIKILDISIVCLYQIPKHEIYIPVATFSLSKGTWISDQYIVVPR